MTIARKRPLNDTDRELIRLVALGHSNGEIADILGITPKALMNRMETAHRLIGTYSGPDRNDGPLPRVRMVIWAYENGLMTARTPKAPEPGQPAPGAHPTLPAELAIPLLALCQSILDNRPRGDLRKYARQALTAARRLAQKNARRPPADAEHERQVA